MALHMNISIGVHCLTTEENMKRMNLFNDDPGILYNKFQCQTSAYEEKTILIIDHDCTSRPEIFNLKIFFLYFRL
jgi:hypothetical protein